MRKSADVVIRMQQNFNDIDCLFPFNIDWEQWRLTKIDIPFSDKVIEYLNALSKSVLNDKASRAYPDLVTFAFYCRKASILQQKEKYLNQSEVRLGRGVVFHIAPSNVPINFAYSLVSALLSGNLNIIRISSKPFPQVDLLIKHFFLIAQIEEFKEVSEKIAIVRYDRTSSFTQYFSSICDVRIIWGGDDTIAEIRKNQLPPRAFDVTFSDRYSLAVINADVLINEPDIKNVAIGFYNDTYLFDQNACTAPHLIVWLGKKDNIKMAKENFWNAVQNEVDEKYDLQSVIAIDKLTSFYRQALTSSIQLEKNINNILIRVNSKELFNNIDTYRTLGGFFTEYDADSINDIASIIKNNFQTLAYYGVNINELKEFVSNNKISGIDRIVPIGKTLDFSLYWDGYNLINTLSRVIMIV